jgi:hypothetical protein
MHFGNGKNVWLKKGNNCNECDVVEVKYLLLMESNEYDLDNIFWILKGLKCIDR